MKPNYLLIPLVTIAVAVIGSYFTSSGMDGWYQSLQLPDWTPPGWIIGIVWNVIFLLSTISALWVWNKVPHDNYFRWIIGVFLLNAFLNVLWSLLFFNQHLLLAATFEAALLGLSVIALIILIWPLLPWAAALLIPYAAWVSFATYLTFTVARMNS